MTTVNLWTKSHPVNLLLENYSSDLRMKTPRTKSESPSESSVGEIPIESSDEDSSRNEGSESASEDSDESESDPPIANRKIKPSGSDPAEMSGKVIPSSSASDCLTEKMSSPVKMKRNLSGEKVKPTWQPTDKAPSSSSEDSEESSSSSDEDTDRNRRHAQMRQLRQLRLKCL